MKDTTQLNLITTDSGELYVVDHLDQVALGILANDDATSNPAFIPTTYSVYRTVMENEYLLEITKYNSDEDTLNTTYKLIPEEEVTPYLDNGNHNVLFY
ncbi:hypothetical protein [Adhaeribacter radiodurans]|uniref:Uncharacterized protein n=1 Tax=Adhaeribacter radiodurans TaxID=2745197 RepID=A0A7L7LB98_9BACT|nr:hypothetical protein [Adhaeribacter radiodurans]QMU30102.1 hypothetical protein HUW48_19635 [Adhaeribacter radiodurans]